MGLSQTVFRALNSSLFDAIQPYRVNDDKLMPWSYQVANPNGRPLHNDWGIMTSNPILKFIQPFQSIPRMSCAYRVPLPFKQVEGASVKQWMLWDTSYPTSPDTPIENKDIWDGVKTQNLPHVLADCAVGDGWSSFAVNLNGEWVKCFTQYHKVIAGKRLAYYNGLKQDITVTFDENLKVKSDLMAWFPEISTSWIKV